MVNNINQSILISAPLLIGELIDKITILKIKIMKMIEIQRLNVQKKLNSLEKIVQDNNLMIDPILSNKLILFI